MMYLSLSCRVGKNSNSQDFEIFNENYEEVFMVLDGESSGTKGMKVTDILYNEDADEQIGFDPESAGSSTVTSTITEEFVPGLDYEVSREDKSGKKFECTMKKQSFKNGSINTIPVYNIPRGTEYVIRIRMRNALTEMAAVETRVDGVDIFRLWNDRTKTLPYFMLHKDQDLVIQGWVTGFSGGTLFSSRFLIADYDESVAQSLGEPQQNVDYGTITLLFREAYPAGTKASGTGTAVGESVKTKASKVKAHFGDVKQDLTIYYQMVD